MHIRKLILLIISGVLLTGLAACGIDRSQSADKNQIANGIANAPSENANNAGGGELYALFGESDNSYQTSDIQSSLPEDWNTEEYDYQKENRFLSARTYPFSTFAADVDTASYANIRRMLYNKQTIPADAVRIEEFINYFHYDYPEPNENEPFSVTTEIADCPWNPQTQVLEIGLAAKSIDTADMPNSNLVFLIDVSGSMDDPMKLPLVQRSFLTLAETLTEKDTVSIITYSSGEEMVLDGVNGTRKAEIVTALEDLHASGSTNGQKALEMAYETAAKHFIPNGNNRIILATDGDFNVGITSEGELTRFIEEQAKNGVALSVLGFGMGNIKDNKMESMADHGNGNYAYIDTIVEARKALVEEAGGTLLTVAKDVKLQVEFNPAKIKGYRLIGYENRALQTEDFADDSKDGGEIGAGHQVTALYEIVPVGSEFEIPETESKYSQSAADNSASSELLTVNIRYKEPAGTESELLEYPVTIADYQEQMPKRMSWACGVAQIGMLLKQSEYAGTSTYQNVYERLAPIANDDYRKEFIEMIQIQKNGSGTKTPALIPTETPTHINTSQEDLLL